MPAIISGVPHGVQSGIRACGTPVRPYRSNSRVLLSKIRISISYNTWHKESTPWYCFLQYLVSHFKARCQLCRRRRYRRCDTCGVVRDDRVGIMITLWSCIRALITTGRVLPICWVIHMCHRFDPFFYLLRIEHDLFEYFFSSTNIITIFTNSSRIRSFWPQIPFLPRSFGIQFSAALGTTPPVVWPGQHWWCLVYIGADCLPPYAGNAVETVARKHRQVRVSMRSALTSRPQSCLLLSAASITHDLTTRYLTITIAPYWELFIELSQPPKYRYIAQLWHPYFFFCCGFPHILAAR